MTTCDGRRGAAWRVAAAGLLLGALPLAACKNVAGVRVNGRVLSGETTLVAAVAEGDARARPGGIEGGEVEIVATAGRSPGAVVATGRTDREGNFALKLSDPDAVKAPAEFRATAPGHAPVTGLLLIPPPDRRVIIVMKPAAGAPGETGGTGAAKRVR